MKDTFYSDGVAFERLKAAAAGWVDDRWAEDVNSFNEVSKFEFAVMAERAFQQYMDEENERTRQEPPARTCQGSFPLALDVPDKSGGWWVYFLKRSDKVVYVGMTGNLRQRLKAHKTNRGPLIETWAAIECETKEHALEREAKMIRVIEPEMNTWSAEA